MRPSPFLEDPRSLVTRHVTSAVASPMEQVRAIEINAAIHHAEIAKACGLLSTPAVTAAARRGIFSRCYSALRGRRD